MLVNNVKITAKTGISRVCGHVIAESSISHFQLKLCILKYVCVSSPSHVEHIAAQCSCSTWASDSGGLHAPEGCYYFISLLTCHSSTFILKYVNCTVLSSVMLSCCDVPYCIKNACGPVSSPSCYTPSPL